MAKNRKRHSKLIDILLLVLLIAASAALAWMYIQNANLQEDLTQTRESLNELSGATEESAETAQETVEQAATDTRSFLALDPVNGYTPGGTPDCNPGFNQEAANTTDAFTSNDYGYSIEVPYNSAWGNDQYRLNPYDVFENKIFFGNIGAFEGCGWVRDWSLEATDQRSVQDAITQLTSLEPGLFFKTQPARQEIAGLTTVQYTLGGLCDTTYTEVIGSNFNYVIAPICDDFATGSSIEELVGSLDIAVTSQ